MFVIKTPATPFGLDYISKNILAKPAVVTPMEQRTTQCLQEENIKKAARIALGANLLIAGISHLSFARKEFRAQVPDWVPLQKDDTVILSGIAEIAMGTALIFTPQKHAATVGKVAAAFFTAVFPGNVSQLLNKKDAFGLDTDTKRFARLFFQPVLVYWALKSTSKTGAVKNIPEIE